MRFLLVSDVHLDTPFAWARPPVARARRQGQIVLFSQEDDVLRWVEQRLAAPQDSLVLRKPVEAR